MGPIGKSGTLRVALVVLAALAALTLTTCGGKKRHAPPTLPWLAAETEARAPQAERPGGADSQNTLMERLTAALTSALKARGGKVAAVAPVGDGNLIVDLDYIAGGVGGNRLVWHYRNLGDYDQNGTVSLGDITPLAMHFGETIAENPLVEVIDGDLDGAAGMGDVQAIADNYGSTVAGYVVESAAEEQGEYAEVGSVEFAAATGGDEGWKELAFSLPTADALWYRVVPVDAEGARGIESLPVQFRSPSAAPHVTAVSPRTGEPDAAVRFAATVEGEEPFSYYWYFGDMGTPSSSTEAEPLVVLLELGRHVCRVQVSNAHGQHTYFFAVLVTPSVYPPFIERVQPTSAVANTQVQFFAQVHGTEPFEYHWNFGGGAFPDETDDAWPEVVVGDAGEYACELEVTNGAGSDSREFTLDASSGQRGDWWMFGRGPTHSRRSPYVGAQTATVKWRFRTPGLGRSSPAIDVNGTVYIGGRHEYLYAVNADGTQKWYTNLGWCKNVSPAIDSNGTIYAIMGEYLSAINPDGTIRWRYCISVTSPYSSSPAIGADGTVYLGSEDRFLYAINPDGTLKWRYETGDSVSSSPAIGTDGTIYIGSDDSYIYAINPDSTLRWRYETGSHLNSSPAIGADGTIYVGSGDNNLYSINSDGTFKWRFETDSAIYSSPAIGVDDTIYVGSCDKYLYALNPDGTLKWRYKTGNYVNSSPAIGADGTIYVGSDDRYLYALNFNGALKWRYKTDGPIRSSPAIGADGTVYVGSVDGYLYAFHHESPPVVVSVSPTVGKVGEVVDFTAKMRGAPPFSYCWLFGDGATPSISNDSSPAVAMGELGEYDVLVTVTNAYGGDAYRFRLSVYDEPTRADWWMFGRDPKHTRRSPYVGAQTGNLKWQYDDGISSPAICADGTIYVGSWFGLDAVNPNGTFKWRYETEDAVYSSPAIGADGTVYVGSNDHYFYAVNPDGSLKWRYKTESWVQSSPAIGTDGTVYVGSDDDFLYAISPDGILNWRYETEGNVRSSPAIGADGTIYVGSFDGYLYAINPKGSLKWRFMTEGKIWSSPSVNTDGTVYAGSNDGYFYAIRPDGSLRWGYRYCSPISTGQAIGADGTIYLQCSRYLLAINPDGTRKWWLDLKAAVVASPTVGADGTIYINSSGYFFYAFTDSGTAGTLKWQCYATGYSPSSPAIGADGTVYVAKDYLYAFRD